MNIIYLLIGWGLGLFSPLIIDRIKSHFQRKELKQAFFAELKEIRYRMVCLVSNLAQGLGVHDRELYEWVYKHCVEYSGTYPKEYIIKFIETLLKSSDKEISALCQIAKDKENVGLSLKRFSTPFVDSKIDSLSLFDIKFQTMFHEIRAHIDLLNQEIDNADYCFKRTFDITDPRNFETNHENLMNSYQNVKNESYRIVNMISNLISQYS